MNYAADPESPQFLLDVYERMVLIREFEDDLRLTALDFISEPCCTFWEPKLQKLAILVDHEDQ